MHSVAQRRVWPGNETPLCLGLVLGNTLFFDLSFFLHRFFGNRIPRLSVQVLRLKDFKMKIYLRHAVKTRILVGTSGALLVIQVNNLKKIRLSRATDAPIGF